jgi:hypothetical protein
MATELKGCTTEDKRSLLCVFFLCGKKLNSKDIHKEMFPVYCGNCLSRKAVHKWVANVSLMTKRLKRRCGVAETTVQRLLCSGFRRTGKAMGQLYQCWWRICREINVFFLRFEYHTCYVSFPFVIDLLTFSHMSYEWWNCLRNMLD